MPKSRVNHHTLLWRHLIHPDPKGRAREEREGEKASFGIRAACSSARQESRKDSQSLISIPISERLPVSLPTLLPAYFENRQEY